MAYVYTACPVCVTIFSIGGNFQPVSNFTELYALTIAAHSYVLLVVFYIALLHIKFATNVPQGVKL